MNSLWSPTFFPWALAKLGASGKTACPGLVLICSHALSTTSCSRITACKKTGLYCRFGAFGRISPSRLPDPTRCRGACPGSTVASECSRGQGL